MESIVTNHPFIDGNKRTGYVLMRLLLLESGRDILADQEEKYAFVIDFATSKFTFEQIVVWIQQHMK
ncbi:type II toxin-antitoxin system death-on-curing family toxin [Spirosoma koreense]